MLTLKKTGVSVFLLIAVCVAGFFFLLKGCLAKYDERFIRTPALYFNIDSRSIILAIVEYQKATSYSRQGGFVRKSVSTSYYLQTNDGNTAELIQLKKIKNGSAIKNYPVEILGASGNNGWFFINEPMCFNALTLEKIADINVLEQKNPALKGLFPGERKYYDFDTQDGRLYLTAQDGTKWMIDTKSLLAQKAGYNKVNPAAGSIEEEIKKTQILLDTLNQQKNRRAVQDYSNHIIDAATYRKISAEFYKERELLDNRMDSLRKILSREENEKRNSDELKQRIESLQNTNLSFSQCKTNHFVTGNEIFMLYSDEEIDNIEDRYWNRPQYNETARRTLFAGHLVLNRWKDLSLDKISVRKTGSQDFLDGGYLLDKQTALPIRTKNEGNWLIIHKNTIGKEGRIMLTCLKENGSIVWTINTKLSQWSDWIYTGDYLYVFGQNNEELSSSESNLLMCINLKTGVNRSYDYFRKKVIPE